MGRPVEMFQQIQACARQVVDVQQLPSGRAGAPVGHVGRATGFGLVIAADECRQQMRAGRRKVVAWPVQVGGHRRDPRQAMLAAHRLDRKDAGDFGDRVRVVGRLQRTGEQRALRDRLRGEFRVDARRAQEQQPRHPRRHGGIQQVDLDLEVFRQEIGRVGVVGQDAADPGRRVDDDLRPRLENEVERRGPIRQIKLGA